MQLKEFEVLTGFYPTSDLYAAIEEAYQAFEGDKAAFCKAYRENEDGIAESIRNRANTAQFIAASDTSHRVLELEEQVKTLQRDLDQELEWRPYEDSHNVTQADYEKLVFTAASGGARILSDEEAKDWLYKEYGFAREKVAIIYEVDAEEINRHHQVRKSGEKRDRRPIYGATDHHYIRFDTDHWRYEVYNGQLRAFY